jgi:succinylglutamate desuccinylase
MERLEDAVDLPQADVLFASHHGRDTGKLPTSWLEAINPKTVVLGEAPSRQLNYYSGYNTITQNSAGTIAIVCELGKVHFYVSERDYSVSFLDDEGKADVHGKYIGSLGV